MGVSPREDPKSVTHFEVVQIGNEHVTYAITDSDDQTFTSLLSCPFEIGNHGDISIVNSFTNKRLWIGANFDQTDNLYVALRRAIEVAESLHFLGDPNSN